MGLFNFVKAGGKKFGSIVGTKANVPTTKLEKTKSKLNILKQKTKASKAKLNQELDKDIKKDNIIHNSDLPKKSRNITFGKFLSYIIVSIISFAVFVILIDTLKTPLINIFPGLEILLFNLFETLQDIKLFIIDLS